ncbi:hypothetical protein niasHT_014080 [Heterodera trifolii]|uniref:RBR-type E3 ubiquitin transferase n=1 Tax=Heterodera trifolii TaxID=157864 RepID=A0ABD2LGJ8_9BILA
MSSSLDAASDSCPSELGCEEYDYYATDDTYDQGPTPGSIQCDPEYVEYSCMDRAQVETLVLDKTMAELMAAIQLQSPSLNNNNNNNIVHNDSRPQKHGLTHHHHNSNNQQLLSPSLVRLLLHLNEWNVEKLCNGLSESGGLRQLLMENHLLADHRQNVPPPPPSLSTIITRSKSAAIATSSSFSSASSSSLALPIHQSTSSSPECSVCFEPNSAGDLLKLDCGHGFCRHCWLSHVETQLQNGVSTRITCMSSDCPVICHKEFVLKLITFGSTGAKKAAALSAKYENSLFRDFVSSHSNLRICTGAGCEVIIFCKTTKAHRVCCVSCGARFCFKCGKDYHAPASCEVVRKWRVKCEDDSETANYISAHTKDCPNCHSCIEKNGGCNHMQCSKCKHHFCWMCFRDWKTHGSEYYECSRYKENPQIAQEANNQKARRALERYLHYFERFENHHKSLKMEEELRARIKAKIEEKVRAHEGTWIDWQYLHDAATLLTKCRYTLQYTYPFAFYMEPSPQKELFEYQQAQLEKEIEELSWKVERAEHTDRAELENQMHVAELKRRTLLQDFFS